VLSCDGSPFKGSTLVLLANPMLLEGVTKASSVYSNPSPVPIDVFCCCRLGRCW